MIGIVKTGSVTGNSGKGTMCSLPNTSIGTSCLAKRRRHIPMRLQVSDRLEGCIEHEMVYKSVAYNLSN